MNKHPQAAKLAATIHLPLKVTNEALENILGTALDNGGSDYWLHGRIETAGGQEMKADYHSECLAYYNQELELTHDNSKHDKGPAETARLTKAKLVAGLELFLQNGGNIGVLLLDDEQARPADADEADMILQYALFKTAIFG